MRIPRYSAALVAALTLAGSVGAASQTEQALDAVPAASQELLDRLARAELLAGITEVRGPGLIITLRHSPRTLKGVDPDALLIHDQDLNGVLNALRAAGAEALAVSGARASAPERILVTSAATAAEEGIMINGTKLVPPYRILALGGGDAMRTELFRPGGVVKKAGLDTLQMIELENVVELVIPACRKAAEPKFARGASPTVNPATAPGNPMPAVSTLPLEMPRVPSTSPMPLTLTEPLLPGTVSPPATSPNRVVGIVPRNRAPMVRQPAKLPAVKPEPLIAKTEPVILPSPEREPVKERMPQPATKAPPVAPAASPMPATDLGVFGGKGLAKYHAAGCRFGERIEKVERTHFNSAEAARQAGRVPCSICLPGHVERASSR